jgi:hypothetical protein
MSKHEAANRMMEIRDEMLDLLSEAQMITKSELPYEYERFKAYVFEQIKENLEKGNPYNQDFNDIIESLNDEESEESDNE